MKTDEEMMEILEAFDLTGSQRAAAELAGCDHHTVARYVALRDSGRDPAIRASLERLADPHREKIEEWVERSHGSIRADIAHGRLVVMGYRGCERTTRRALAEAKTAFLAGRRRVYRPWIPEPGMWLQWDFGQGPLVGGRLTQLFCLWLAWSRFRVVFPILDKTLASVTCCLDRALRVLGGVPTYGLSDNEKTITTDHIARIAVRNPEMLAFAAHYGLQVATCIPADPESKGGVEATVRIAKADIVPTDANLLGDYASFAALEAACEAFMAEVNSRPHRATGRPPVQMLAQEQTRLHPLPAEPHVLALGQPRTVSREGTISLGRVRYSVPWQLVGSQVLARVHGEELVVVALTKAGPREVARHELSTPGNPRISDEHYPPRPEGPLARTPKAQTPAEAEFLAIGQGARRWLISAAASGQGRIRSKMAEAVTLAKLHGGERVERALQACAEASRFGEADLALILAHQAETLETDGAGQALVASEQHTLQAGTGAWARVGR